LTATFLLADVEGSTALWEQAPQEMAAALARQDGVAGRVIARHGGTLARSFRQGGAPLAGFEAADTACACAIELQRAFGAEHWPTPIPVSLCIALHGGTAEEALAGASRLRDIGHGGQILVSGAVANACEDAPPGDAWLRPLLPQVFQLCAPGLRDEFSPLRCSPDDLLERDAEIARLTGLVELLTQDHSGGAALVEGPPGIGKSALLGAALAPERTAGATVLRARGTELEAGLAYGGVRQLLSAPVLRLSEASRQAVFAGPAALARPVLGFAGSPTVAPESRIRSTVSSPLVSNLAERTPLVLAIDDLHWLDEESGRFVAHLSRPARRSADPAPRHGAPARAGGQARAYRRPGRVRADDPPTAPEPRRGRANDPGPSERGGAPGDRRQPAAAARAQTDARRGAAPCRPRRDRPVVGGAVRARARPARLRRCGRAGTGGGVVCDGRPARGRRRGRGPPVGATAAAADGLVVAQVLAAGDLLSFVHPLMRSAVYEQLGGFERRRGHATAAARLRTRGAPVNEIAAHVLSASTKGEPENVRILVAAAAQALERAAPRATVRYLERALAEPPQSSPERAHIGHELGRLQGKLGRVESIAMLEAALRETDDAERRIDTALDVALVRYAKRPLARHGGGARGAAIQCGARCPAPARRRCADRRRRDLRPSTAPPVPRGGRSHSGRPHG